MKRFSFLVLILLHMYILYVVHCYLQHATTMVFDYLILILDEKHDLLEMQFELNLGGGGVSKAMCKSIQMWSC